MFFQDKNDHADHSLLLNVLICKIYKRNVKITSLDKNQYRGYLKINHLKKNLSLSLDLKCLNNQTITKWTDIREGNIEGYYLPKVVLISWEYIITSEELIIKGQMGNNKKGFEKGVKD